ncbi:MAG TPA: aldo/keto reductase [Vicinamibacterales bacterium]|nr:aldo/keto reductase [Vicinamibacterales bacterium]
MRLRPFGRLGWPVSEVGYGLWGMGGWSGSNDDESLAALERAIEKGCTFFDTALAYGNGKSEQLLGRVLARRRDVRVVVATKIPPKNLKWPALASYALDDVFPADHIRKSTEISLRNLNINTIDVQQFHVWSDAWAADDRWQRAVADLKHEGLVRAIGISVNRWEPSNVVRALETGLIDSVQVVYNVFDQNPEDELFPACRQRGVAIIARVPFDEGSLTGTMTADMTWPEGDWRNLYFTRDKLAATLARVDEVKRDVPAGMSLPELALRFILASPDVATVIPGMRRVAHVDANLAAGDGVPLATAVVSRLRRHRWERTYVVP